MELAELDDELLELDGVELLLLLLEVEYELLDLLLELNEIELLFLLLDEDDESELLELLLLLLDKDDARELLDLRLELLVEFEKELLDLLLELDGIELLLLLLEVEDDESELLDLLVDNADELLESVALDVTALLRGFEVEELAGTIALLVCPPVATDTLDELLELVLLLELIALLAVGELLELGAGALELVTGLVFVPLNPDALEPPPPPQALKILHNKTACAKRLRVKI